MTQFTNTNIANLLQKMDGKMDAIATDIAELKIDHRNHQSGLSRQKRHHPSARQVAKPNIQYSLSQRFIQ